MPFSVVASGGLKNLPAACGGTPNENGSYPIELTYVNRKNTDPGRAEQKRASAGIAGNFEFERRCSKSHGGYTTVGARWLVGLLVGIW
ncbi:MAG: hypothetical protein DRJ61_04640 [Acidobacteria bacterium]|nr:MAG: hypothetical protein DRJ61_04640 [Acidobacteriota bacterium]